MDYTDINKETINRWVDEGWEWSKPISHEEYLEAKDGILKVGLTPCKYMPRQWFPKELKGLKILGLCSGGGQQGPVFCAHGMDTTIIDYSDKQIESENEVAKREGYKIRTIIGDITKGLPFKNEEFDIIFNPVSLVYIKELEPIFKECYRVLKKGGILVCGLDNGINFITNDEVTIENKFPFDPTVNKEQYDSLMNDDCGIQFSHNMEENIGYQLKAGFVLTDIYDDINGEGRLSELNIPSFFATRCIKPI